MDNIDNDKIKEQIEEELYEDGLRGKKLERAVDKRFLQEVKVKQKPIIETNISGSGLGEYTTKYYPESGKFHCSCPGYWRSSGNCKHVKVMRTKFGDAK